MDHKDLVEVKQKILKYKEIYGEKNFLENYALLEQYPTLPKGMIPMCKRYKQ